MEALEETYKTVMEKPLAVLNIFNEFFGEDKVDMQGFPTLAEVESKLSQIAPIDRVRKYISNKIEGRETFILVHFPHVRITNEYDRFTDINHLYAKVPINIEGQMLSRFSLNRSEYTVKHFTNRYMH